MRIAALHVSNGTIMMMEEMNHVMKRMLAQCAGSTGALLISYLLSRYLFFDLHGMKSFPFYP